MKILPLLLQFKHTNIDIEIDAYKNYLSDINKLAEREKRKLVKMVDEIVKANPEEEFDIHDHYSEQYELYNSKYAEFTNNNSLVSAYSFFEVQLNEIHRLIERHISNKKGRVNPKNVSYAEKLKKKIYAITGLDFSSIEGIWTKIDEFRIIRNLIVHNGGNIIEDSNKLLVNQKSYEVIISFAEIKLNSKSGDFKITEKLANNFLDIADKYLKELITKLEQIDKSDMK